MCPVHVVLEHPEVYLGMCKAGVISCTYKAVAHDGPKEGEEEEEEEEIHYVHTASKGLRGRLCHEVWACLRMANTKAQMDFWSFCHMKYLMAS